MSGADLVKALRSFDYQVTRQKGSHIRISTVRDGEHHETIPNLARIFHTLPSRNAGECRQGGLSWPFAAETV